MFDEKVKLAEDKKKCSNMVKQTKVRNRQLNKSVNPSSESLEERLNKIETIQAKSSSNVLKFAFFFFMGVGLTIVLYPEISKTLGGLLQTKDITVDTKQTSAGENIGNYIEQEYDLDEDDGLNDLKNDVPDDSKNSKTPNLSTSKYVDKKDESIKHAPLTIEKSDPLEDELIHEDELDQSSKKTDRREERDIRDVKLMPFTADEDDDDDDAISLEPEVEAKEVKFKREVSKNKKTSKDTDKKATKVETPNTKQELPKEILEFNSTMLKGVTPKKIFADGRRIPPMELLPQKPNNSSVK